MLKVFYICICVLICSIIIKQFNKPFALAISIAGVVLAFFALSEKMFEIIKNINNLTSNIPSSQEYINLMIKVLFIVFLAQIISQICKDNGEGTLSTITEISAKVIIIVMILPLFETVVLILNGLVKWKDFLWFY